MKRNCYKLSWTFSLCRFRFRFCFCFSICFCFCFCFCLLSFFSSIFFVGFSRRLARLIDILYLPLGAKQNIFEILYLLSCSMRRRFTGCAKGNGGGGREERRMLAMGICIWAETWSYWSLSWCNCYWRRLILCCLFLPTYPPTPPPHLLILYSSFLHNCKQIRWQRRCCPLSMNKADG